MADDAAALAAEKEPSYFFSIATLWLAAGGLTAFKIWLIGAQHLTALGYANYDDALFIRLAHHILAGQWLGPYDQMTLIKGPFYPMFIAATDWLGLPLLTVEQLFYAAACGLLVLALRPLLPNRWVGFLLYVLLLFNPYTFDQSMTRILRCGIYPALTILVLAAAVGLLLSVRQRLCPLLAWSGTCGLALAAFWLTREEGVWLLPSAGLLLAGSAGLILWKPILHKPLRLGLCLLPIALLLGINGVIIGLNRWYYGIPTVVELKSPDFLAAYGALTRVKHPRFYQYYPVPRPVREQIYRVSPAFAELRDYFEGIPGRNWSAHFRNGSDIAGGWFLWALRDAVARRGDYRDVQAARDFYRRLARQVNAACAQHLLACGPPRATLMPPWNAHYWRLLPAAVWQALKRLVTLANISVIPQPSGGARERLDLFKALTHETLTANPKLHIAGWAVSTQGSIHLQLRGSQGFVTPLRHRPSPDVYLDIMRHDINARYAHNARFDADASCSRPCYLLVSRGPDRLARLPVDGARMHWKIGSLYVHLDRLQLPPPVQHSWSDTWRIHQLRHLTDLYATLVPFLAVLALGACVILAKRAWRDRSLRPALLVCAALVTAVAARLVLLAMIDVTSFHTLWPAHLSCAAPPLLALAVLASSLAFSRPGSKRATSQS